MTFDWTICEADTWPPPDRLKRPYGPTMIEIIQSCPLRTCFEASASRYERRLSFSGRIGTAFHHTMEWLIQNDLSARSADKVATDARNQFHRELASQIAEAEMRPRERGIDRDETRIHRATEAVISEALRFAQDPTLYAPPKGNVSIGTKIVPNPGDPHSSEVEINVRSQDGLFRGRIDRIEHRETGTHLVDYKSALRDDLPDRYTRQVQLYAKLWQETRGSWPTSAEVVYPLANRSFPIVIDPEQCDQVVAEARDMVYRLEKTKDVAKLSQPGDVCKVCEFRPWCKPFWHWQAYQASHGIALERANMGIEGTIETIQKIDFYWSVEFLWREVVVTFVVPQERFPHLNAAKVGTVIRLLDVNLQGLRHRPRAIITPMSELFFVQ